MFNKVLVANRGEIAVRVIRALREMGIRSVAVYSEADRESLHVMLADEAVCIGPAPSAESYLNMEAILSAAVATGAQAIHPGYGFLSENARFAGLCKLCGITWIGPSAEVIERMGDKSEARSTMKKAGVPVIPGTAEALHDAASALKAARKIGFPVMIKASAGGGGKGMRRADSPAVFEEMFRAAQAEAASGFGDDSMYLERCVQHPKHVEVQILADRFGNVVHVGERDCSVQRRHQKVLEESPCAALTDAQRARIGKMAVRAAKAAGYENAGTIEFLLEPSGRFYFMEMNTRIQVEHPVTEQVSGIDLIKEQIRIAAGEKLCCTQRELQLRGHAIECRINAERPELGFLPSPGKVSGLHLPGGNGVRVDTHLYQGYTVSPHYDSMLLKLIVHGKDREEALAKLRSALGETVIEGVHTNIDFLYEIINHKAFAAGRTDTDFIPRYFARYQKGRRPKDAE
ncbi:MAG: acetyl-CoA carboxylase biotin carboxylase subunit [Eubacteriales bacterium]|nr:acetyl-CoA carboxylase biotin carboxylase subunit [Eubacteriales bacterium]